MMQSDLTASIATLAAGAFWPSLKVFDLWVMLTASIVGALCGVLGTYLLLRRMSMLGDAISHAILPGLAGAFLLSGTRDLGWMLLGAGIVGLLTALGSTALSRLARIHEDASMGVVFTTLFALGVILISFTARNVDLDPSCVLYGVLELTPFDTVSILGTHIPRATLTLGVSLVLTLALLALFHKEIKIVAFDPALATALGLSAGAVHFGMVSLIAGVSVVSFEAVGSVLVVAMLVVPAATAHLLTDRYTQSLTLAGLLGAAAGVLGYLLAMRLDASVAGCMSVAGGAMLLLAMFIAPRHGLISRAIHRLLLRLRIGEEDVLGDLFRAGERGLDVLPASTLTRAGGPVARVAIFRLQRRGSVRRDALGIRLTDRGRAEAQAHVRAHRLWERFLVDEAGLPSDHVHDPSHRAEHFFTSDLVRELEKRVAASTDAVPIDPHGRRIPPDPDVAENRPRHPNPP